MKYVVFIIVLPYYLMYWLVKWLVKKLATQPKVVEVPQRKCMAAIRLEDEIDALDTLVAVQIKECERLIRMGNKSKAARLNLQIVRNNNKALKLREELEKYV